MSQFQPKTRVPKWLVPGLIILGAVTFLLVQVFVDFSPSSPASANAPASPTDSIRPASSPTPASPIEAAVTAVTETPALLHIEPEVDLEPTPIPASPTPLPTLPAESWKQWPVIPLVSENARLIYRRGLALGNDPHKFSVLGDCQSLPETFMGLYDNDPTAVQELPAPLRETVVQFKGAFSRMSPTLKAGTTSAAVLWYAWHEGKYGCGANESPLDCELRLENPSIVVINLGTHYETRNIDYLRKILDRLIDKGILPVLSTKADNRELDDKLNYEMALLAIEYDIPLWNFYAAVKHLPENGVSIRAGEEHLGVIYLTPEALEIHQLTALQALDAVWKAVR